VTVIGDPRSFPDPDEWPKAHVRARLAASALEGAAHAAFRRHADRLLAFLGAALGDRAAADVRLMAEVSARIRRSLPAFDHRGRLGAWCYAVAWHAAGEPGHPWSGARSAERAFQHLRDAGMSQREVAEILGRLPPDAA